MWSCCADTCAHSSVRGHFLCSIDGLGSAWKEKISQGWARHWKIGWWALFGILLYLSFCVWSYLPGSLVLLPFFQKDFLEASILAIFAWATSSDTPSPVKILDVYIPILGLLIAYHGYGANCVMINHVIYQLPALRRCANNLRARASSCNFESAAGALASSQDSIFITALSFHIQA